MNTLDRSILSPWHCIPLLMTLSTSALFPQATENTDLLTQSLCIASTNGRIKKLEKIISQHPDLKLANKTLQTSGKGSFKGTALHYAVGPNSVSNNDEVIACLLAHGWNPNNTKNQSQTPLHVALHYKKNFSTIKTLVDAGTHLFYQNKLGDTPLHCAIHNGEIESIVLLLINGAPLDILNKKKYTPAIEPINSKITNRYPRIDSFVRQLIHYAQLFNDSDDKVSYIIAPVTTDITPQAQQLGFKTLVETCELNNLIKLYEALSSQNPRLLKTLLATAQLDIQIKIFKKRKIIPKTSAFCAALCTYWLTMPQKIVPHVKNGKLDSMLASFKTYMPLTKIYHPFLMTVCGRMKALKLLQEQQKQQNTDVAFGFV